MRCLGLLAAISAGCILALAVASRAAGNGQNLDELEARLKMFSERVEPLPRPEALARRMGDLQAVYEYVRDQIAYQDYPGLLRGPLGTLQSGAGNHLDQSQLLVTMMNQLGGHCRYARGKRQDDSGQWVEHYWVQVKEGEEWVDYDPALPELRLQKDLLKVGDTMTALPSGLVHRVRLKVIFRVKESDRIVERTALEKEFAVAELCGTSLTLSNRFDGRTEDERFVLEVFQPVLELGDELFPGETIPRREGHTPPPASRLTGIFDPAQKSTSSSAQSRSGVEVLGQRVAIELISPDGRPDRFVYTVFEKGEQGLEAGSPLDGLINAVAFCFSPVLIGEEQARIQLLDDAVDIQLMIESLHHIQMKDFSSVNPPQRLAPKDRAEINLALEAGNRALAQAVLLNYLWRSDEALDDLNVPFQASAFRGAPRAIMASVTFRGDRLRYDLDLRRNPATYLLPEGSSAEWIRFLNYHRGLYESRLEGAVMMSFTGQSGLTAGDVLAAAREQGIPLRAMVRKNRLDLSSLRLEQNARSKINKALNDGKTVLLPERPVILAGAEQMAWFEFDPVSGTLDGVFPSGKHQAMTEYILEDVVMKGLVSQAMSYLVSTVAGYYFSIATGLGHFYACLLDLETPNTPCFGTG
jgi:hypothetical protein